MLFGKKKEETKQETPCCCGGNCNTQTTETVSGKINSIKVLGSGCKSCHQLYENAKQAASGMNIEVEYITDLQTIMSYGVMSMPALVVNDKVVLSGRVANPAEIEELLGKQ